MTHKPIKTTVYTTDDIIPADISVGAEHFRIAFRGIPGGVWGYHTEHPQGPFEIPIADVFLAMESIRDRT